MDIGLAVNVATILLLLAALFYGVRLSRSIDAFMKSRTELGTMFRTFDRTIAQAREHMQALRETAEQSETRLRQTIDAASILLRDLENASVRAEAAFERTERSGLRRDRIFPPEESPPHGPLAPPPKEPGKTKKQLVLERMLEKVASGRKPKPEERQENGIPLPRPPAPPVFTTRKPYSDGQEEPSRHPPPGTAKADAGDAISKALEAFGYGKK
jgi:hypothetical protein